VAIALEIGSLRVSGQGGIFLWVKAYGHHVELLAHIKWQNPQATDQPVQQLITEHGALIVNESQDDRLGFEIIAQPDNSGILIPKCQMEWHLFVQPLLNANVSQHWRAGVLRLGGDKAKGKRQKEKKG